MSYQEVPQASVQFLDKIFDKFQKKILTIFLPEKSYFTNFLSEKVRFVKNKAHPLDILSLMVGGADFGRTRLVRLIFYFTILLKLNK